MFEKCKNSNFKGNVGLGMAISYFTKQGLVVSLPLNDSQDYDLIFDDGKSLNKVQIKTTSQVDTKGTFKVKIEQCSHNFNKHFDNTSVEYLFVLCENGDLFLIPSKNITAKALIHLGDKYKDYKINNNY